ncbi:hypothetical protein HNQ60_002870 [Povalibacter uvarum]|uniref:Uncharacterized protein n=1 Tax=Povalibacter uvarum TaxID=732238 RepID=A0A841HNS3_9GAMM|nr:hypothetical protein [Povalibacter uvarum]MBB6093989.1 hypothetical protein [Povalibacter uvarum]
MSPDTDASTQLKVYTTEDGRTIIEQSSSAAIVLSADQILTVINELRVCYDYCAAWKEPRQQ